MKKVIASAVALFALVSCSNNIPEPETPTPKSETPETPKPETPEIVLNTGRMLSLDGPYISSTYEYDDKGRVVKVICHDHNMEYNSEYKYDNDRIYVSYQQYRLLSDGEYDIGSQYTFSRQDTLFLVNGRVDSCAGAKMNIHFFFKYRYNERGELIHLRNENVNERYGKNPCYEEELTYEWENGNITKRTSFSQNRYTTTVTYRYSSLTGNLDFVEPRNYLIEFDGLVANGYYGVACKNLVESVEYSDGFIFKYAYELDEHQKVKTLKDIRNYDEEHSQTLEYNIKWDNTQY